MSDWMPIESAPGGCEEFQAWVRIAGLGYGFWEPRCRYNDDGVFQTSGDEGGWDFTVHLTPTHWMPQPSRPKGE